MAASPEKCQRLQDSGLEADDPGKNLWEPTADSAGSSGDQVTWSTTAADLRQENEKLNLLVRELTKERDSLAEMVSRLKRKLQDSKTKEENLTNQYSSMSRELDRLRQQLGTVKGPVDSPSHEDQSEDGRTSISSSAQRQEENSDFEKLKRKNEELVKEIKNLQKKYNTVVRKGKKNADHSSSAAAVREIGSTIREIENLEKRTSSLKTSLFNLTASLETEEYNEQDDSQLQSVEVEIWEPNKEDTEWKTVALTKGERCWRDILPRIDSLGPALDRLNLVVIQWGHLYSDQGRTAQAIQVLDHNSHISEFRGRRDGAIIEKERCTHSIRQFLHPAQPVITCAGHTPLLTVVKECKVMSVARSRYFRLVEDHFESLFDPESLILIWGLWFGRKNEQKKMFIQLNGRSYCDSVTGDIFENEAAVYAAEPSDQGQWHHLLLILRSGDRVPWLTVPEATPVAAFTRFPCNADITQGRVQAKRNVPISDGGMWVTAKEIGEFDRKLTAAMLGEL